MNDAVEALISLAECPETVEEVFNVGSVEEVTILELAQKVLELIGECYQNRIVFIPYEEAYEAGFEDMQRRVPDISKIKKCIGWVPKRSLERALKDTISSYKNEGVNCPQ